MMRVKFLAFCALLLAPCAFGQLTSQGQELPITSTEATVKILINTPVSNLIVPTGQNTFILTVNPASTSARVYITNDTANACSSLVVGLASTANESITSFNANPQAWSSVQLANGTTTGTQVGINLPGLASTSVTSQPIIGSKIALFLLLPVSGACGSTNIDVQVVFGNFGTLSNVGSNAGQVQGPVLPPGSYSAYNPVVTGGVTQPTNTQFLGGGLDVFRSAADVITGSGVVGSNSTPTPTQGPNELAIAFSTTTGAIGGALVNAPWTCGGATPPSKSCAGGGSGAVAAYYNPAVAGVPFQINYNGASGTPQNALSVITVWKQGTPETSGFGSTGGNGTGPNSTAAGSQIEFGIWCAGLCSFTSLTSSLGNSYAIIATVTAGSATGTTQTLFVVTNTNKNPGGTDLLTVNGVTGGTLDGLIWAVFDNPATAIPNEPTAIFQTDQTGAQVEREDAQFPNQFNCSVTLSTNTTTQCQPAPTTINGIAVRPYITDFQIQTTVAGTATTIQIKLGTGVNCATGTVNASAITYPNTAIGLTSVGAFRTPLFNSLVTQQAVCATQAGTTAGTTLVEIHGFFAP